ncbi:ATP-binding protein [uncultured Thiodictyon sp.]|uniref:AAA family ATPase n=1 Tax=uncultured Thiodictyon sp. TaxID=1846217 RepID=UPI0025F9EDFC|nr:ATP-binding protein [uncultured Thiodictyon sp.]
MNDHGTLWRTDFTTVPAAARRAARYALQLVRGDARLRQDLKDSDVLAALWELTLPLLDPDAVVALLSLYADSECHWTPPGAVDWEAWDNVQGARRLDYHIARSADDGRGEVPSPPLGAAELRERLRTFFRTLPRRVLRRLAQADAAAPTSATIALLGEALALDATAVRMLDFLEQRELVDPLRLLLRANVRTSGRISSRINLGRLATLLGLDRAITQSALARCAPLRALGLVDCDDGFSDLEDFLSPTGLLREVLEAAPRDAQALLALLIEPAPAGAWRLDAFPQLAEATARLEGVLRHSSATAAVGVNALFYGPPGTGKTELARALAAACGLRAYQVRSADEDGDGLRRTGRLSAYLLAQRLLGRRRDAVLIFDEVEDVFGAGDDLFALLRGSRPTGRQKGWMNRILEENPVPAIWITNDADSMDPAFLRRFLLPVAFVTPPRSVRRAIVESHLGDRDLPPSLLDELAADAVLTPAQLGAARRLLDLHPTGPAEQTVRAGVAAVRTLLYGAPAPRRRTPATRFDVAFLNLAGGIAPNAIARALAEQGRGSLCFYGPPGTGKTAFAEVLAEALDRELVARQASDLISPYVGQTEQNLARLFRDCDPAHSVLLLDEVDSLLSDRRAARHSWERTQVNELLQQMERYPGIFIAATNLIAGIDAAALRRFDFKLHFRALTPAKRLALFAREALEDTTVAVAPELARYLETLQGLTAGDFANVCRQRTLLGEGLTPEQFLRRLAAECRLKQTHGREAA